MTHKMMVWKILFWSVLWSLGLTLSHLIPFNVLALLLFIPLTLIFPQLGETGDEVTIGFAWLEIHATWVWGVIFAWHLFILIPLIALISLTESKQKMSKSK